MFLAIPKDGAIGSDGKITVEFEVVNEQTSESLTAHQAFVVFYNTHNDVETTFIAEKKKSKYVASGNRRCESQDLTFL